MRIVCVLHRLVYRRKEKKVKVNVLVQMFAYIFIALVIVCFSTLLVRADDYDKEIDDVEFIPMEATAYCYGTTRCDGGPARLGICATDAKHYGMVACIYEVAPSGGVGKFIGYYECLDTGGDRIRKGEVIDIYNPSYEWCRQFGRKKVLVAFRNGVG